MRKSNLRLANLSIAIFVSIGCIKEKTTSYSASIINEAVVNVEMIPYRYGVLASEESIKLNSGDSVKIASGTDYGIVDHAGFDSDFLSNTDSLVVIFSDTFKVVHYLNDPQNPSIKFVSGKSERNLLQLESYSYSYLDISKYKRSSTYWYTFTESDYEYAKQ
ncbi:MAG: hypothetical protein QM642_10090 [Edaphocola sp.]